MLFNPHHQSSGQTLYLGIIIARLYEITQLRVTLKFSDSAIQASSYLKLCLASLYSEQIQTLCLGLQGSARFDLCQLLLPDCPAESQNKSSSSLPQGLCTGCSMPRLLLPTTYHSGSLSPLRCQLQYHLFKQVFQDLKLVKCLPPPAIILHHNTLLLFFLPPYFCS